jgi:hypothetical protein
MFFYWRLSVLGLSLLTLVLGGWMLHQKYEILILERLVLKEENLQRHLLQTFQNKEAEWSLLTNANRLHALCHQFLRLQPLQAYQKQSLASFQSKSAGWMQTLVLPKRSQSLAPMNHTQDVLSHTERAIQPPVKTVLINACCYQKRSRSIHSGSFVQKKRGITWARVNPCNWLLKD